MGEDLLSAFSNLKKKEPQFVSGQLTPVTTAPMAKPQAQEESPLSAFAAKAAQRPGAHPALAAAPSARPAAPTGDSPLSLFNASTMKSRPVSTAPAERIRAVEPEPRHDFTPKGFKEESPQRKARVLTDDDVALYGDLDMIYSDKKQKDAMQVQQRREQNQVRVTSLISTKEREAARPRPVPTSEEARLALEREQAKKRVLEEWKKRASMMR